MARNIFQYALLGGIQGGAQGLAQGMAEEQRFERERQLMAEREAERRRYLEERDGATRGTGSRAGGSADAPFDPVEADKKVAYLLGKQPEDLPGYERGDDLVKRTKMLTEDGSNPVISDETPANIEELKAKRREELRALRGGAVYGKDFKDVAAGMATVDDTARLGRIEQGDKGAVRAKLADKGQGEYDNMDGGVFNKIDGGQKLNSIGVAKVNNERAGGSSPRVQSVKENDKGEIVVVMSDGTIKPSGMTSAAFGARVGALAEKLASKDLYFSTATGEKKQQMMESFRLRAQELIASGKAPADPSPASAAPAAPQRGGASTPKPSGKAPYQEGQRLRGPDGKTYVVRNGKPVPA